MPDERDKLPANDNEEPAEDEDVQAHARAGQSENANEDLVEDVRDRIAANTNEDEVTDDD